jgi:hypothetical protein
MIQIQYAFKDGIRYDINDPLVETGQRYLLIDNNVEYEVYPAKGEKNNHHFRSMPGVKIDEDRIFHLNCQYYIQDIKKVEVDNLTIKCNNVLLEAEAARYIKAKIPDYSMRPDCLFLDGDGEIMCIVEVNVTHAKSDEDIEKIKQYKIITIELTYGKQKDNYQQPEGAQFLYQSEITSQIRDCHQRIKIGQVTIHKHETERNGRNKQLYNVEEPEIKEFEREIRELERGIKEEEGYITSITNLLSRCMGENYKKRLENEQRKQS